MARNLNQPDSGAASTVFSNLDLDPAEFDADTGLDDVGDDLGEDNDGSGFEGPGDGSNDGVDTSDPFAPVEHGEQQSLDRLSQTRQPPQRTREKFDAKGNVLGPDGRIIAKAGNEARLHVNVQKARGEVVAAQGQVQEVTSRLVRAVEIGRALHTENEQYKAREQSIKEFGFTPADQITALQLFQSLKNDTAGTIRKLLTRAAAQGINVNGGNNNNGTDVKGIADAIREELQRSLKPIADQTTAQVQQQQQEREAREATETNRREVESFFALNQEAKQYLPVFVNALKDPRFKGMSLPHIWDKIQLNLLRNGGSDRRQRTPRNGSSRGSLPNGRPAMPGKGKDQIANPDVDYGDILKGVLDEAGV